MYAKETNFSLSRKSVYILFKIYKLKYINKCLANARAFAVFGNKIIPNISIYIP